MNHHERLYQTRLLMSEIETSVSNLTDYFADRESMPSLFYDGTADAAVMLGKFDELKLSMRLAYYSIADEWNNIISNDVRRHEVGKYIKSYRRLRMFCRDLYKTSSDDHEKSAWVFNDSSIIRLYAELFAEMNDEMTIILEFYSNNDIAHPQRCSSLEGIAKSLKRYLEGVDDEFFESLIIRQRPPAQKVKWLGKRNEACLFAIHFGLDDYQMNQAFVFKCHTRTYRPLKISSDKPNNAYETYDIYNILKKYFNFLKTTQ